MECTGWKITVVIPGNHQNKACCKTIIKKSFSGVHEKYPTADRADGIPATQDSPDLPKAGGTCGCHGTARLAPQKTTLKRQIASPPQADRNDV